MEELRSIENIEMDNPGFWIKCRYDREGVEYSVLYRDASGANRHVHCRDKNRLQPLIDHLKKLSGESP
jgi:hypothetical protein